jgi:hypothetical protein
MAPWATSHRPSGRRSTLGRGMTVGYPLLRTSTPHSPEEAADSHEEDVVFIPTAGHYARYNATAPIEASSGPKTRHRLNPRGNRHLNHALHLYAPLLRRALERLLDTDRHARASAQNRRDRGRSRAAPSRQHVPGIAPVESQPRDRHGLAVRGVPRCPCESALRCL